MKLLKDLCAVHAPSGDEAPMKEFLLSYINRQQKTWKVKPELIQGPEFQDCLILAFGNPRTAIFAHMDSIGFTVRYDNQLVPIGGPDADTGTLLVGEDSLGPIECKLVLNEEGRAFYEFGRAINRGTSLTYKCNFRQHDDMVTTCYLDNRLGVYNALKVAETLEHGVIVFSAWEEHGGGSVQYLTKYLYERWQIKQALVSDITWVTDGVHHGKGVVVSMRDKNIPRKSYVDRVIAIAQSSGVPFQLEVEGSGSSDGRDVQISPYPIDWCFVGAPESNVHSPNETVHKDDISAMVSLYEVLMAEL
ncbi:MULTISPECIES: aminopeptidase [unclassified Imperialibacter]|uniref:aminopeptidase n=1 Tax=unclassified Imperialibacter TaxID=2629706 RepID=UPI001255E076|nr:MULTISPECIES: aminopeptidase [unclassified Imperialibacter]CAD5246834.1 Aminopeptidase [Imperialibacter sp. 75]CAD5246903.1 Aminopeptidase [Imperialibacter sp. 89]VVS96506.1 Aminopeptidase [Imperialibacter sp. EC-SDR9]